MHSAIQRSAWVLVVSIVAAGCAATQDSVVKTRYAREAGCAEPQVKVEDLGGSAYKASGCGTAMTYVCAYGGTSGRPATCVKEGTAMPDEQAPAAPAQ
jgi:hypothetical protein